MKNARQERTRDTEDSQVLPAFASSTSRVLPKSSASSVTIALFHGSSAISKLIRWQTRSAYSHAALLFADNFFIEAREFIGVRGLQGLQRAGGESVDLFTVELTDEQADEIRAFALAQLGKPYDYTMVARFVSRRSESRRSRAKWFCSELVFAAFAHAGVRLLRATEPWEVSPGLLARAPALRPLRREINVQPLAA